MVDEAGAGLRGDVSPASKHRDTLWSLSICLPLPTLPQLVQVRRRDRWALLQWSSLCAINLLRRLFYTHNVPRTDFWLIEKMSGQSGDQGQDKIQSHHLAGGLLQVQFQGLQGNSAKLKLGTERALLMLLLTESQIFNAVPKHMIWKWLWAGESCQTASTGIWSIL